MSSCVITTVTTTHFKDLACGPGEATGTAVLADEAEPSVSATAITNASTAPISSRTPSCPTIPSSPCAVTCTCFVAGRLEAWHRHGPWAYGDPPLSGPRRCDLLRRLIRPRTLACGLPGPRKGGGFDGLGSDYRNRRNRPCGNERAGPQHRSVARRTARRGAKEGRRVCLRRRDRRGDRSWRRGQVVLPTNRDIEHRQQIAGTIAQLRTERGEA